MIELDIAQIVAGLARIGRRNGKSDLPTAAHVDHHAVIAGADDGTARPGVDHDGAGPGPFQHIIAVPLITVRGVPDGRHPVKRGGSSIAGKIPDPAVGIKVQQPGLSGIKNIAALGEPWPGHQELIDERERRGPIDKAAQVGSKGWSGHSSLQLLSLRLYFDRIRDDCHPNCLNNLWLSAGSRVASPDFGASPPVGSGLDAGRCGLWLVSVTQPDKRMGQCARMRQR